MKILVQFVHLPVTVGEMLYRAGRRLGLDIYTDGYSTGHMQSDTKIINRVVLPTPPPADWKPDLVILAETGATIDMLYWRECECPVVVYEGHAIVRNYRPEYDATGRIAHWFLAHKNAGEIPHDADTTWLPVGYDTEWHAPSPVPWQYRNFDAALIGETYINRARVLEACARAGLKVTAGMAYADHYAPIYHQTRVALNWAGVEDLSMRIFEGIAMGCIVVTNPLSDLVPLMKEPDFPHEQLIIVDRVEDFPEAVRAASEGPAPAFDRRWIKRQRWEDRLAVMVEWARQAAAAG